MTESGSTETRRGNVARLRRLDCCAVSDALERLKISGVVTGFPRQSGAGAIAGQVITVKLGTGDPPPGATRHLGTTAIEAGGPDHVIAVEQRTGIAAACWGGLLSLGAKMRGIAGLVADGPVRDIDQAQAYNFPIFAHSLTSITARGRLVEKGTNVPINIGTVTVNPGDYVIADRSAVVFVPSQSIEEVLAVAEMIMAREAEMAKAILRGEPISGVMGKSYETMLRDSN
jgi:4-hydroxy-4-methyl-2-oxoglutarate aldolase